MSKLIEITAPRESWVDDFLRLKPAVMRAAPDGAYLHHIGSTAVPGLAAKDIIDIQVTVDDLADVDDAAFEREGFKVRPGIVGDHCPPGLDLAESELRKLFFRSSSRPANVHIREKGRFNQRFHFSAVTSYVPTRLPRAPTRLSSNASPNASRQMSMPITISRIPCSTSSWRVPTSGRKSSDGRSRQPTSK